MKCKKCGAEIEDWAVFCRYCGAPAAPPGGTDGAAGAGRRNVQQRNFRQQKKKRKIWPIVVTVLILLLVAAGAATGYFVLHELADRASGGEERMTDTTDPDGVSSGREADGGSLTEDGSTAGIGQDTGDTAGETSVTADMFQVDADTIEDYSNNLDPDQYAYYDSGISDFNFYYPADLYNSVTVSETPSETDYGTRLQTVHFTGSKGSELLFEISRRTDNLSLDEMREEVYQNESGSMSDPVTVLNRLSEEMTHGKVIVSGYSNAAHDEALYDMVKIEDDYVLQMKVIFPYTPDDMENNRQQNYVVDCLYRLCGFSDTSYESTRSYEEFRESLRSN